MKLGFIGVAALAASACGGGAAPGIISAPTALTIEKTTAPAPVETPNPPDEESKIFPEDDAPLPITADDPVWGSRTALVTIVEFADFQCPFCARVQATLDQVKKKYGPDDLRLVWKHQPLAFHVNARPAAEASAGVHALGGSDAFWKFHDLAFKNAQSLSRGSYETWATASGVDGKAVVDGLDAHRWAPKIDLDAGLANRVKAHGTPQFFINGVRLAGAQPIERFVEAIEAQMSKAREKIASGVPRGRIYVTMVRENMPQDKAPDY